MNDELRRCEAQIACEFRTRRCTRAGKVQVGWKWYCGIHDPKVVKRRRKEQEARWAKEARMRTLRWKIEAQRGRVVEAAIAWYYVDLKNPISVDVSIPLLKRLAEAVEELVRLEKEKT